MKNEETPKRAFNFKSFYKYVEDLYKEGKATGNEQSKARLDATFLNLRRMDRLYRKTIIKDHLLEKLSALKGEWEWTVITEGWCGDAAQNLPVLASIADHADNIDLKIILRDENPAIMDRYLTNGGRAIPKLICRNKNNGEELGTWGPRPEKISRMVKDFKAKNPKAPKEEFNKQVQLWYAKDKAQSLFQDLVKLMDQWKQEKTTILS